MSTELINKTLKILLVEDSYYDRDAFRRAVERGVFDVEISECVSAEEAIDYIVKEKHNFDLIVSDYNLMEMNGLDMYLVLRENGIETPLVILTGSGDEYLAVKALKAGVDDYIIKDPDQGYIKVLPVVLPNVIEKNNEKLRLEKAQEERNILLHDLGERVKELTCMYNVFESIRQRDNLQEIFEDVISFIPPGWQYPEITCARIVYQGDEYTTDNFEQTQWKQDSDININGEISGSVQVYYLQEKPELDEGPFLKEERYLVDGISRALSEAIERFLAKEQVADMAKFPNENPNPVMRITNDGILLNANPASQIFLTDWHGEIGSEIPEEWKEAVWEAFETGCQKTIEVEYMGHIYSFLMIPVPETNYVNVYGLDITERKEAEQKISDMAKFPSENPNPVIRISKDGILLTANPASQIFLTEWQGKVGMEVPDEWKKAFAPVFKNNRKETLEFEFKGRTYSFLMIPVPETNYVNIYGLDITDRKEAERQREIFMENLEQKNQEIERFMSIVRHDIGNPILSIQGFSEELAESSRQLVNITKEMNIDDTVKEKFITLLDDDISLSIDFIQKSVNQIKTLLQGLKFIASVGKIPVKIESIDVDSLISDITSTLKYQFQEKDFKIDVDKLPCCKGDFEQIKRVFTNLLTNAVKYLDPQRSGKVRISGSTENKESVYCVEDNGIGISPENQDKVFDVFYREDASSPESGEGLGLSIVSKILERHNGKIWLQSEPGVGSKFYVRLPQA